jgi:hypothetical protein
MEGGISICENKYRYLLACTGTEAIVVQGSSNGGIRLKTYGTAGGRPSRTAGGYLMRTSLQVDVILFVSISELTSRYMAG